MNEHREPAGAKQSKRWLIWRRAAGCFALVLGSAGTQAQTSLAQSWGFNDAAGTALNASANTLAGGSQWTAGIAQTLTDGSGNLRFGYNASSTANSYAPINTPTANVGGVYVASMTVKAWDIKNGADSGSTRPIFNFSFRSAASTSSSIVAQAIFTATPAGVVLTVRDTSANIYPIATLPSKLPGPLSLTFKVDKSPAIKTYTLSYAIDVPGGEAFSQTGNLDAGGNARVISHLSLGLSGNFPNGGSNLAPLIDRIEVVTGPAPQVTTGPPAYGRPGMPSNLLSYFDGNRVQSSQPPVGGPALLLMGGGAEVNTAFTQRAYPIINGGDIVVLRISGSNGYQPYFFTNLVAELPANVQPGLKPNSVETLIVDARDKANSAYVANAVAQANMIWIAGGDQSAYIDNWRDTELARAVKAAYLRGAVIGGTSAGMVVATEWMYDPGLLAAVTSAEAVTDPYRASMILSPTKLFDLPLGFNILAEPHFQNRDRMGRSLAFMARLRKDARSSLVYGVALDERTALFIDKNNLGTFQRAPFLEGKALGDGYILREDRRKTSLTQVVAGQPLIYRHALRVKLSPGQSFDFARATSSQAAAPISVEGVVPVNSY